MSHPLDAALRARYQQIARQRIEVPEWGPQGEPFVLYARPFVLDDRALYAQWMEEDARTADARLLMHLGRDEAGQPIGDAATMMLLQTRAESHVVRRVVGQLLAGTSVIKPADKLEEAAAGN